MKGIRALALLLAAAAGLSPGPAWQADEANHAPERVLHIRFDASAPEPAIERECPDNPASTPPPRPAPPVGKGRMIAFA